MTEQRRQLVERQRSFRWIALRFLDMARDIPLVDDLVAFSV
jgi:hypothetical protein